MRGYFIRRALQALITMLAVTTMVFFLVRLSGDPAALMLGQEATPASVAELRSALGLDEPLPVQYVRFIGKAIHGDLGRSIRQGQPAMAIVLERLPATARLAISAFSVATATALLLGVLMQVLQRGWLTTPIMWLVYMRQAIPTFVFAISLILIFSVSLGWLPTFGSEGPQHLILPTLALATYEIALYVRLLNSGFGEQLRLDYVRTARGKGLREIVVVFRHTLPNVLLPIITIAGIHLGGLLGGAAIVETIFSWPGVGQLLVQAIDQRDYPLVQASVIEISAVFVTVNFLVDLLAAYIDPRVRLR
jgi:peptide/nickel transport system permease protein